MLLMWHWPRLASFRFYMNLCVNATMWLSEDEWRLMVWLSHQTELLANNNVLCSSWMNMMNWVAAQKKFVFRRGLNRFIAGGSQLQCLHFSFYKVIFVTHFHFFFYAVICCIKMHWAGIKNNKENQKGTHYLASVTFLVDLTNSHAGQQEGMLSKPKQWDQRLTPLHVHFTHSKQTDLTFLCYRNNRFWMIK